MNVAVCNFSIDKYDCVWFPYLYFRLKTYFEKDFPEFTGKNDVKWFRPIFNNLEPFYNDEEIGQLDIIFFSCYIWNIETHLNFAEKVKSVNPKCLVVFGGPQIVANTFYKNVDIAGSPTVEGEITCSHIIKLFSQGKSKLEINKFLLTTAFDKLNLGELSSPWLYCKDEVISISKQYPGKVMLPYETNRGCPYACNFCDWGSATQSKIRRFNYQMLEEEISFLSTIDFIYLFINDANFGIFKHDPLLLKHFVDCLIATGKKNMPAIFFCAAKNNMETVNACYEQTSRLNNYLPIMHFIGLQHLDPEVIGNMDRKGISTEKLVDLTVKKQKSNDVTVLSIITGCPGDTPSKLKKCIDDILNLGFHTNIHFYHYMLLPNAPASDPKFLEEKKVKIINKILGIDADKKYAFKSNFIAGSYSYSDDDYVDMQLYVFVINAFQFMGLTRFIATFLNKNEGINFSEFYEKILQLNCMQELVINVKKILKDCFFGPNDFISVSYKNTVLYNMEVYFYKMICDMRDQFYQEIYESFQTKDNIVFKDVIKYQQCLILIPENKTVQFKYDWQDYFSTFELTENLNTINFIYPNTQMINQILQFSPHNRANVLDAIKKNVV